jgi:hypothetical protein
MKPGDMIKIKLPLSYPDLFKLDGSLGIILSPGKRAHLNVWKILLENGKILSLEPISLELIHEKG